MYFRDVNKLIMEKSRSKKGRFSRRTLSQYEKDTIILDHPYHTRGLDDIIAEDTAEKVIPSWKIGRRLVEWEVFLQNLKFCQNCGLGPVPLTLDSVKGELQKGLSGYLYVECSNNDCQHVNTVAYGKTHRDPSKPQGMPCFVVNTKLGTAMIDNLGGPKKVNNLLSTLNLKPISEKNLKEMEKRSGEVIEQFACDSASAAAKEAFINEMSLIADAESREAQANMSNFIDDLGVGVLPDASPSIRSILQQKVGNDEWTDDEDEVDSNNNYLVVAHVEEPPLPSETLCTPTSLSHPPVIRHHTVKRSSLRPGRKSKTQLLPKYPCRTRHGMSVAVDTAWQKKGFDSLTSHTFFMTTDKTRRKKVVKTIVGHRTCGVCMYWRRKRKGQKVRPHRCVWNHRGSARAMEATGGVTGVKELMEEGTPIEYLEGDGDNTLISRLKKDLNVDMKKRYDKNHVVKNVTKSMYILAKDKSVTLSKNTISHLEKCLKYAFSKNQNDQEGMKINLQAIVPHQFGDHSLCQPRFCGYKRKPGESYLHRSLPYKLPLKQDLLRLRLQQIFDPLVNNAKQYTDLGSSQQCEHANKEVTLRAPKSHHYGNSASLDYRVQATAAFINDGRHYISESFTKMGLSPGEHTQKYAEKCTKHRMNKLEVSSLPSTKRRRLVLKQERSTNQGASEVLEGDTYKSGIGHESSIDIDEVPVGVTKGSFKPVTLPPGEEAKVITIDLETTGLIEGRTLPHITQLAAIEIETGKKFNTYVTPSVPISQDATRVTGISFSNNEMKVNGQLVTTTSIQETLDTFKTWLSQFSNVCLVAHNGRRFDFPILVNALQKVGSFNWFCDNCAFLDSLSVFRKLYPKQSLKQEYLVSQLLGETYAAHDAMADVIALGRLISFVSLSSSELMTHSFKPDAISNNSAFNDAKARNLPSLCPLLYSGVMKRPTAENIAGSGLHFSHLQMLWSRGGEDAIRDVFTCRNADGLPRVTGTKKVLEDVVPKLCKYFSEKN